MSLLTLPAEVQKSILISLDYASLCQIRSTGRYFYNMLTEPEIHEVFLDIDIPQGDYHDRPKDGQTCAYCALFCDGTAAQEKNTKKIVKLAQKKIKIADEKLAAAYQDVELARNALTMAKAAVKATKVQKEKRDKRVKVVEAQQQVKLARESVKAAILGTHSARGARDTTTLDSADAARTCHICKRKFNGYMAPGLLAPNNMTAASGHLGINKVCSRVNHLSRRLGFAASAELMQKDGKICKICWKSGRRGASGIQRRRTFIEEFGYWLREDWLMQAKAVKTKGKMLADKSFGDIEKEEEAAGAAQALVEIKKEADDDTNCQ